MSNKPKAYFKENLFKFIKGVALLFTDGTLFYADPPYRHHHLINYWGRKHGRLHGMDYEEGFIDSYGNFITRKTAYQIAIEHDLIFHETNHDSCFSENLWGSDFVDTNFLPEEEVKIKNPPKIYSKQLDTTFLSLLDIFYKDCGDIERLQKEIEWIKDRVEVELTDVLSFSNIVCFSNRWAGKEGSYTSSLNFTFHRDEEYIIAYNHFDSIYLFLTKDTWSIAAGEKYCLKDTCGPKPILNPPSRV